MRKLTYVWVDLMAWHTDPYMGEGRHSHTWRVFAYFEAEPFRDGRSLRASLSIILSTWQGQDLPRELWAAEDLAAAILQAHGNADCIGIRIERTEGFGAEAWKT